jgi:hypothetical protein
VKAIFLEGNALSSLAGLPPLIHLRCLCACTCAKFSPCSTALPVC